MRHSRPTHGGRWLVSGGRSTACWSRSTRAGTLALFDVFDNEGFYGGSNLYFSARERRYHYPGALQGFWGSVYRDEAQRCSIVYVSNNSMPQWLRPLLTRALVDLMEGRRPAPIVVPDYVNVRGAALADVAGHYVVDAVGRVTVTRRGETAVALDLHGGRRAPRPLKRRQAQLPGR